MKYLKYKGRIYRQVDSAKDITLILNNVKSAVSQGIEKLEKLIEAEEGKYQKVWPSYRAFSGNEGVKEKYQKIEKDSKRNIDVYSKYYFKLESILKELK